MITTTVLKTWIFKAIKRCSCQISPDVRSAFIKAIEAETGEASRKAFESTLDSLDRSVEYKNLACPDTGWPLFFCKIGNDVEMEGGFLGLEMVAREMVAKATREGHLRATMKHPITGEDPGNNVGTNIPGFTYKFVPGDSIQITFVAKGGGSECFGGTRYRVVAFADGLTGIKKSILDWYIAASRAGAICPPSILGIGIGGTADIASDLAKQAASLRLIGSHHPEREIAHLETDLATAVNKLGIGPMGAGGNTSVFAVNIEYSHTHLAGIALAMSANCWIARRATTRIHADGRAEMLEEPNWFGGR